MRPCSSALNAYLADPTQKMAAIADLYTFALVSGEVLRYSGWTTALAVPAASFPAGSLNASAGGTFSLGPPFERSKVTTKIGVDPTELDISILAGHNDLVGTLTFADAARVGFFDGATVELDRLFSPPQVGNGGIDVASLGCLIWFYGRVAEIDIGRSKILLKVKSLLDLLSIHQFPRRVFQSSCTHIFGQPMCGYDRVNGLNALGAATGAGAATIAAAAGTTQGLINAGTTIAAFYTEGAVTGLTGFNAGISRTIANNGSGSQIGLFQPFPFAITVGDTFEILPGCDHTVSTCTGTFNNLARYGGFPHIPPPEAAF